MRRRAALGAAVSHLFDVQASDARLDQVARLTAAKFWKNPEDEDWGSSATFMFKTRGRYVYCVLPIFRRRYWAAVRVAREDIPPEDTKLSHEDVEVISVSVMEPDALALASNELQTSP